MILYCMGTSCQLGAASSVLPLHAGYRRTIPCQATFCHSREGGNPSLDLSFPWASVIPAKAEIHSLICPSPPEPFCSRPPSTLFPCEGRSEGCFRREGTSSPNVSVGDGNPHLHPGRWIYQLTP